MKIYKVVFFGTPEFSVPYLQALLNDERFEVVGVVTQSDKPVGRKQVITFSPVKHLAIQNSIPVFQPTKLKGNIDFWEKISLLRADINLVVAYGKILPQQILDSAAHGSVNVHGSRLPKYRGASPIQAAILNGDTEICVTFQKMVFEMDAGPILAFGPTVTLDPKDTYDTLATKLSHSAASMTGDVLQDYIEGKLQPTPQKETDATYVQLINKEDGLIDWNQDETIIDRMIRAYTPWPGAYTILDGQPVKILGAQHDPTIKHKRGMITNEDNELFIGNLRIDRLQLSGRNAMSGRDFLRGYAKYIGHSML